MRNTASSSSCSSMVRQRLLGVWRRLFVTMGRLHALQVFVPLFGVLCALTALAPLALIVLPQLDQGLRAGATIVILAALAIVALLALRGSDPGYVVTAQSLDDSPLTDVFTLETLHAWAVAYPELVAKREAADNTSQDGVSLASGANEARRKEALAALVVRMSVANKLGEEGASDLAEAITDLQTLMGPSVPPVGGYTLAHLPPPPSRPHHLAPTAPRHAVLSHDAEEAAKFAVPEPVTSDKKARSARRKERKAREEKARYETRRRDGDELANPSSPRDSALELEAKELDAAMISATSCEEEEDSVRERSRAPPAYGDSASAPAIPGALNPFANSDNFFKHDFATHPIDERERASLIARARAGPATAASSERPPTDEFFVGNPRWNPTKLKDDLERFAMDRFGIREEFCLECMVWRPLGAKHCDKCGLCVNQWTSHPAAAGCCIGRLNVRFLLALYTILVALAITAAYCSVSAMLAASPFTWASWRVASAAATVAVGAETTATTAAAAAATTTYSWNWLLLATVCISGAWCLVSLILVIQLVRAFWDFIKSANYILIGEGGGLAADAPKQRMTMTPLQLMMYVDLDGLLHYTMARAILAPLEVGFPCTNRARLQSAVVQKARHVAKQRRAEWRDLRQKAIDAAKSALLVVDSNTSSSTHAAAPASPRSPHHAVEILQ